MNNFTEQSVNILEAARQLRLALHELERNPSAYRNSEAAALYVRAALGGLTSHAVQRSARGRKSPIVPPITQSELDTLLRDPLPFDTRAAARFDPVQLALELIKLVNGPGGMVEQTYLYLDEQSADDWLSVCSTASFTESYRKTRPVGAVAAEVAQLVGELPLDINALGPGDGKSEVALIGQLRDRLPASELRLHLLDINHSLLVVASSLAVKTFQDRHINVLALCGDFHKLHLYEPLLAGANAHTRRRLYTLLGYTLSNLDNELGFLDSLAACSAPGDLVLVDLQTAVASPDQPDEIKARDPLFNTAPSRAFADWLTGPIRRYGCDVLEVTLEQELCTECLVPGSYEINLIAHVELVTGQRKRFAVGRFRRYEPTSLGDSLRARGWSVESMRLYGGPTGKGAALMLLRRATA